MQESYNNCKKKTIQKYIKIYEKIKLKKKKVSRKQTIAISLSLAQKECENKLSKDDIKIMEDKINIFINTKDNKLKLSLIKMYKIVYKYYISKKLYKKVTDIQDKFMKKIIKLQHDNILSEKLYKEIIQKLP
jgi:hypothetical protein